MHKRVKIENDKVVGNSYYGQVSDDSAEVVTNWVAPNDYPISFYHNNTSKPVTSLVGDIAYEDWSYILSPINVIKDALYKMQAKERHVNQLGVFDVNGVTVTLQDRDDYPNIMNLDLTGDDPYKVSDNVWIESDSDRALLKTSANDFVKAAFIIERDDNAVVNALTTIDELKDYYVTKYGAY
ncbi:MAG TPA: hypothetical protein EYN54_06010 [Methylococcaceae bacterium]|nr:hypothetical protein [Methylococcaceae bacterium]